MECDKYSPFHAEMYSWIEDNMLINRECPNEAALDQMRIKSRHTLRTMEGLRMNMIMRAAELGMSRLVGQLFRVPVHKDKLFDPIITYHLLDLILMNDHQLVLSALVRFGPFTKAGIVRAVQKIYCGRSILHRGVMMNSLGSLTWLYDNGCDFTGICPTTRMSMLQTAIMYDHVGLAEFLISIVGLNLDHQPPQPEIPFLQQQVNLAFFPQAAKSKAMARVTKHLTSPKKGTPKSRPRILMPAQTPRLIMPAQTPRLIMPAQTPPPPPRPAVQIALPAAVSTPVAPPTPKLHQTFSPLSTPHLPTSAALDALFASIDGFDFSSGSMTFFPAGTEVLPVETKPVASDKAASPPLAEDTINFNQLLSDLVAPTECVTQQPSDLIFDFPLFPNVID